MGRILAAGRRTNQECVYRGVATTMLVTTTGGRFPALSLLIDGCAGQYD